MLPPRAGTGSGARLLRPAALIWLAFSIGTLGVAPVYPDIARDLAVRPSTLGAVLGISFLVTSALQLPFGILVDRFGHRGFVIVGTLFTSSALALWGVAQDVLVFALGQATLGIANVALQAGCTVAVAKAYSTGGRAHALSLVWAVSSGGTAVSLLLFGIVGGQFGWRPLALSLAWIPIIVLPIAWTFPEPDSIGERKGMMSRSLEPLRFLLNRRGLSFALMMFLLGGAGVASTFLFAFIIRANSYSAAATAIFLMPYIVGPVLTAPLVGALADRFGYRLPLMLPLAFGMAVLIGVVAVGPQPLLVIGCLFVIGSVSYSGQALMQSLVADAADRTAHMGTGAAMAGVRVIQALGPAVAPGLTGLAYVKLGAAQAELGLVATLFIAALLVWSLELPPKRPLIAVEGTFA